MFIWILSTCLVGAASTVLWLMHEAQRVKDVQS
jgi:hypothetical protein